MSVSATGAASAYDYLHSLIKSPSTSGRSEDPMAALFSAFFPAGTATAAQASRARHHHAHGTGGTSDPLLEMMAAIQESEGIGGSSAGASGTAGTATVVEYASITTLMVKSTAALSIGASSSASGSGFGAAAGSYDATLLAQMFQSQTDLLFASSGTDQTLFDRSMLPTNMLRLLA